MMAKNNDGKELRTKKAVGKKRETRPHRKCTKKAPFNHLGRNWGKSELNEEMDWSKQSNLTKENRMSSSWGMGTLQHGRRNPLRRERVYHQHLSSTRAEAAV